MLLPADKATLRPTHSMLSAGADMGLLRPTQADTGWLRPMGTDTALLRPTGTNKALLTPARTSTAQPRPVLMGKMAWMEYKEDYCCCAPTLAQATTLKTGFLLCLLSYME